MPIHFLSDINLQDYEPVTPTTGPGAAYQPASNINPFLRAPLPSTSATPDALRQYYNGGLVPQTRIVAPTSS